jgi:hypothetical protein
MRPSLMRAVLPQQRRGGVREVKRVGVVTARARAVRGGANRNTAAIVRACARDSCPQKLTYTRPRRFCAL